MPCWKSSSNSNNERLLSNWWHLGNLKFFKWLSWTDLRGRLWGRQKCPKYYLKEDMEQEKEKEVASSFSYYRLEDVLGNTSRHFFFLYFLQDLREWRRIRGTTRGSWVRGLLRSIRRRISSRRGSQTSKTRESLSYFPSSRWGESSRTNSFWSEHTQHGDTLCNRHYISEKAASSIDKSRQKEGWDEEKGLFNLNTEDNSSDTATENNKNGLQSKACSQKGRLV